MGYTSKHRIYFERPHAASRYRNVEAMMIDSKADLLDKMTVKLPEAGRIRKSAFGVYNEATNRQNPDQNVITSGSVVLIGGSSGSEYGGHRIGITAADALGETSTTVYTSGKFFLPLDHLGAPGDTPARVPASNLGSLAGKPAYWLRDLGLVTDQKPAGGGQVYLEIGSFIDVSAERQPEGCYWDHIFAAVQLEYIPGQTAIDPAAIAAISHSGSVAVFPSVSTFIGRTVDFTIDASNANPWQIYSDSDISVVIDALGTNTTYTGNEFTHTFASDATFTVDITVDGTTFNYQVVVAAAAAPVLSLV